MALNLAAQAAFMVNAKAEADPDRLLAPTRSTTQKLAAEEPGPVRFGSTSIRSVQSLASPFWRQGL